MPHVLLAWRTRVQRASRPSQTLELERRGQYFWHTRAAIGHGAAVAVAQRARVAGHTLRRPRAPPNARDALLFPATVPSGF